MTNYFEAHGVAKSHIFDIPNISIEIPSITIDIPGTANQKPVYHIEIPGISPAGGTNLV